MSGGIAFLIGSLCVILMMHCVFEERASNRKKDYDRMMKYRKENNKVSNERNLRSLL